MKFKNKLIDINDVDLVFKSTFFLNFYDNEDEFLYDIVIKNSKTKVGRLEIRTNINEELLYFGQIGYSIFPTYQGNNYAYKACLKAFKLCKEEYGLDELIITCSPENIASYKTLEKLKGELVDVVEVPKDHELYMRNEKIKCIFKYKL